MKQKILGSLIVCAILVGGYFGIQKVWADVSSLPGATISQANLIQLWQCTSNAGATVPGTCSPVGVNWYSLNLYEANNVNWQDLPGVTGAPYSASTFMKTNAV